jgi:hypothetical protein
MLSAEEFRFWTLIHQTAEGGLAGRVKVSDAPFMLTSLPLSEAWAV